MDKEIGGFTTISAHHIGHQPSLIQNRVGVIGFDSLLAGSSPALDERIDQLVMVIIVVLAGEVQRHVVVHTFVNDVDEPVVGLIPVELAELLTGIAYILTAYPGTAAGVVQEVVHCIGHREQYRFDVVFTVDIRDSVQPIHTLGAYISGCIRDDHK